MISTKFNQKKNSIENWVNKASKFQWPEILIYINFFINHFSVEFFKLSSWLVGFTLSQFNNLGYALLYFIFIFWISEFELLICFKIWIGFLIIRIWISCLLVVFCLLIYPVYHLMPCVVGCFNLFYYNNDYGPV